MAEHGRTYVLNTEEYAAKFAAWNSSVSTIAAHAARAANGQPPTYTLGLTAFADWTNDEFKAAYLAPPAEKCARGY